MSNYTHTFKFEIDSFDISGEVEFNTDGKMGFKTNEPVEWTELEKSDRFRALLKEFKHVFDCFGSIKKIKLEEK